MSSNLEEENIKIKYFAYYVPENKPVLMQDVRDALIRTYGADLGKIMASQVEANLYANDWENLIGDNIMQSLNSLVLVKITDARDLFANCNNEGGNNYVKLNSSNISFKYKLNNGDNSIYKTRNPTFSGTQDVSYAKQTSSNDNTNGSVSLPEFNYIFIETIFISLKDIFSYFIYTNNANNLILFDAKNKNNVGNNNQPLENIFARHINDMLAYNLLISSNIQKFPNGVDAICIDILKLLNSILKGVDTTGDITWDIMRNFIPLVDSTYNQLVAELWKKIMKNYENPIGFLKNHMLIISNKVIINRDEEYKTAEKEEQSEYNISRGHSENYNIIDSIVCNLNAKLLSLINLFQILTF